MLAAEAAPLVKVGGLGDVAGALPVALRKLGMDVRVMLPDIGLRLPAVYKVRRLAGGVLAWDGRAERVTVRCLTVNGGLQYLVGGRPIPLDGKVYGASMGRDLRKFVFFALAALRVAESVGFHPDVLHVHDAHPGAALHFLGTAGRLPGFWKFTAGVLTIHNLAYQFNDAADALQAGGLAQCVDARIPVHARAGLLALGIAAADLVNTVSHHFRRYTAPELRSKIENAGLRVDKLTYANTFLMPVVWAGRLVHKLRGPSSAPGMTENSMHPDWSNGLLQSIFTAERPLLRFMNLPFGVSLLTLATKPR